MDNTEFEEQIDFWLVGLRSAWLIKKKSDPEATKKWVAKVEEEFITFIKEYVYRLKNNSTEEGYNRGKRDGKNSVFTELLGRDAPDELMAKTKKEHFLKGWKAYSKFIKEESEKVF